MSKHHLLSNSFVDSESKREIPIMEKIKIRKKFELFLGECLASG